MECEQFKPLIEDQLEGKSGASSRGNSSSNSYIKVVAVKKLVVGFVGGASVPTLSVGDVRLRPSLGGIRVALSCRAGDAHLLL